MVTVVVAVVTTVVVTVAAMAVAVTIINAEQTEGLPSTTLCRGEGLSVWRAWRQGRKAL